MLHIAFPELVSLFFLIPLTGKIFFAGVLIPAKIEENDTRLL